MLSDPNARRLALARFVSRSGAEAAFFVGIWGKAAYELESGAGQIALVIAALGLSGLAGAAISGVLVDRFGPKKVLIGAEVVFVPTALSFLWASDLPTLVGLSVLLGLVTAPTNTAIASFPPFLTRDPDRLATMNSVVETAGMAALISGTAIGGAFAKWLSIDAIFVFDAITSLVALALVLGISTIPAPEHDAEDHNSLAELREGLRFSFSNRRLRFYLLAGGGAWTMFGLFSAVEPLFFRDVLGEPPQTLGFVNTVFGLGLVIGTWLVARLPSSARSARVVISLLAFNGIGAILYVGTNQLPTVMAGGFVWAVVIGVFAPIVRTMLQINSPQAMVGRVMGVSLMTGEVGKLTPLVVAAPLVAAFGVRETLIGGGIVLGIVAAANWRVAARLDATRTVAIAID